MALLKTLLVLFAVGLVLVASTPVPEPTGWHGKHEHYIIHVPYHVHTVHHHHVQKIPVYVKSKGWEPHGWW